MKDERVEIVWGDLRDYESVKRGISGCSFVLHMGGMVSPKADFVPKETFDTNINGAKNIVRAIKEEKNPDDVKVVYIGTVAETGDRNEPIHWGRCSDPICIAIYDHYGVSKAKAEQIFAEPGLKHWVSLRQSGIIHPKILYNIGPIVMHVVLRGVIEWATIEDSANLMCNVFDEKVPESFWRNFYNISSGPDYRLTNYEFEEKILYSLGMGHDAPMKIFEPNWFINRNFHGQWYSDADKLENYLHFRKNIKVDEYFQRMKENVPVIFKLSFLGCNAIGKTFMRFIAYNKRFGTLSWVKFKNEKRLQAYFGSYQMWNKIPKTWEETDLSRPSEKVIFLDHGYDENKPIDELDIEDMQKAAHFRGGECLSKSMKKGDLYTPLTWRCAFGHVFNMTPNIILKGGHWCPECDPIPWKYNSIAKVNPFFSQVWEPFHHEEEDLDYDMSIYNEYDEFCSKRKFVSKYLIFAIVLVIILIMIFYVIRKQ